MNVRAKLTAASSLSAKRAKAAIGSNSILVGITSDRVAQKELLGFLADMGGGRGFRSQVKGGLKAGIVPVLEEVLRRVPVLTGTLKKAIKTEAGSSRSARKGIYRQFVAQPTREAMGIDAKSKWYYPGIVHAGHEHAKAIPYMREGGIAAETRAQEIFWQKVQAYILKKLRGKSK